MAPVTHGESRKTLSKLFNCRGFFLTIVLPRPLGARVERVTAIRGTDNVPASLPGKRSTPRVATRTPMVASFAPARSSSYAPASPTARASLARFAPKVLALLAIFAYLAM